MASETSSVPRRFRADRGAGENWLVVDDPSVDEVTFATTNGVASLSARQVGCLARDLLNWLSCRPELSESTARLVRLAKFVGDEVGADPFEYDDINDPEQSALGLVSEFLHEDGAD